MRGASQCAWLQVGGRSRRSRTRSDPSSLLLTTIHSPGLCPPLASPHGRHHQPVRSSVGPQAVSPVAERPGSPVPLSPSLAAQRDFQCELKSRWPSSRPPPRTTPSRALPSESSVPRAVSAASPLGRPRLWAEAKSDVARCLASASLPLLRLDARGGGSLSPSCQSCTDTTRSFFFAPPGSRCSSRSRPPLQARGVHPDMPVLPDRRPLRLRTPPDVRASSSSSLLPCPRLTPPC